MFKFIMLWLFVMFSMTIAQDREIAITVYNNNLGLVKDMRTMDLVKGKSEVKFTEVAASIDPTSVHFKSLTAPTALSILEQNYEYDLISSDKILQKYIDKEITVFTKDEGPFYGTLLSASGGNITLRMKEGNLKIISSSSIIHTDFPQLPEGLITKPTLVWLLDSKSAGQHRTEVSYLTSDINWHAEYVAVSKNDDSMLELNSWVSIDNKSGATYENARLKLVAGEVHTVQPPTPRRLAKEYMLMAAEASAQFEEKPFFEYHLYTLQGKTRLKDNQIKQISLFPTAEIKVKKSYIYDGAQYRGDVRVNLEFKNSKADGLGLPLPQGKVRVYKEDDADKSLEFVGEDNIDHTPRDEKVRIFLGNVFDIKGERIQKDEKRISDKAREQTFEIKLRNHKETAVTITVVEKLYGDWEIRKQTHPHVKKNATTIEFNIPVAKDEEAVLEYTALFRW